MAPFERPAYVCRRTTESIIADGRLDEPAWESAEPIELVIADTGQAPRQRTQVRILWDDSYLYVSYDCEDDDIWGITTERDQDIYNQEVVELFVDAVCDGRGYVEIEVSPLNAVLDLYMLNAGDRRKKGLWDWDSGGLLTGVVVDGDPHQRGTQDRRWTVEMAVPMEDFLTAPNCPPKAGDVWLVNLYRIDRSPRGDEYTAWSPPGRINYHTPERFGRLVFSDEPVRARSTKGA